MHQRCNNKKRDIVVKISHFSLRGVVSRSKSVSFGLWVTSGHKVEPKIEREIVPI